MCLEVENHDSSICVPAIYVGDPAGVLRPIFGFGPVPIVAGGKPIDGSLLSVSLSNKYINKSFKNIYQLSFVYNESLLQKVLLLLPPYT